MVLWVLILVDSISEGQGEDPVEEAGYKVVAIVFFREQEIARFETREQAE